MPLIKRYSNRKLYDTQNNSYINLEIITQMIRDGEDVLVVDNVTGEDLTAVTFAQIIMEQEKKERNFVPRTILAEIIKSGGESLNSLRQKIASTDDFFQQVEQEIATRLESLVQRGEIAEEEGKKLRDQLVIEGSLLFNLPRISDKDIEDALLRFGIPTKEEFQNLIDQVEALSAKLDHW